MALTAGPMLSANNGVNTDALIQKAHEYTGFYFKNRVSDGDPQVAYFRNNSAVNRLQPEDIDDAIFDGLKVLHITGISLALSSSCLKMAEYLIDKAHSLGAIVTFDPNIRPQLWASKEQMRETINHIADRCDIVIPGVSEGTQLTSETTLEDIADFYLNMTTPSMVVLKNGTVGAFAKEANGDITKVPSFHVSHVVDTVGAGDGFATGLISGLIDNLSVKESLVRATAIGALAIQSEGDNAGYPVKSDLEAYIKTNAVTD
ncbi:sugar kinases, ribokinase family [Secundilactobacillus oryzae JCM 18671]|uniref:Sugar kinases, ribokinase family n=2 Tax=Secundilactobacillus oryzae TaxID=1202668 RepID=A0A081BHL1_9LACO|nr:sugar kinase [Secundilactobacillus oryzae]GAK47529.1 sugar kinases, ribokinase family [Secundilactobacillus oryzae JCM 18671]